MTGLCAEAESLARLISCVPASDDDADGDGVPDSVDLCRFVSDVDQADADGDGIGDACDPDLDGDGLLNIVDPCADDPNDSCVVTVPQSSGCGCASGVPSQGVSAFVGALLCASSLSRRRGRR
jgi:hypothetical protein